MQGENGVQCEICELWFHSQCQNRRDESYKALEQQNVHWFCCSCNGGAVKLFKIVLRLNFRQDRMEEEVRQTKEELDSVKEEVNKVTRLANEINTKMESFETMIEAKLMEKVEEFRKTEMVKTDVGLKRDDVLEEIEIEKRKLNLVIMGVKEEDKDEDFVKELFDVVAGRDVEEVRNVSRIGRKQDGK